MKKYKIIALFGQSGAGKDTIQKWITEKYKKECNPIVSCTTRPPREGEVNGKDYFFISETEFAQNVLDLKMIEATEFRGWFYGTRYSELSIDKLNIGVFNVAGIEHLLEDPQLEVYPVVISASPKTRLLRALNREACPDCNEICRRFKTDNEDFSFIDFPIFYIWNNEKNKKSLFKKQWKELKKLLLGENR